ncbi:uncharacterized protein [Clytia hemisphaerica]|uniref:Cnidarian restricted protein n=1 Tax=Clytia hemisphaerica TaxID=252671 RepID=A0A7M5XLW1_9CNID
MDLRPLILAALVAVVFSHRHPKIGVLERNVHLKVGNQDFENEVISVDLKKPNEDIRFVAQVRIHLIEGNVHVNGHRLVHNQIHQIKMMVIVIDIVKGVRQPPKRKAVSLRIMVEETNVNGVPRLYVEEEFIRIGEMEVEQIDVHQIIWESSLRKPITTVKLVESKIHKKPRVNDHPMFISDEQSKPHLPKHGFGYDEEEMYERRHHGDHKHHKKHCHHHGKHGRHHDHHHDHHHGNGTFFEEKMHSAKCWYRTLSWRSKVLLFSVGFFGLLSVVICCGLCSKRRRARRALSIQAPMDDSVTVDTTTEKPKAKTDNKHEFHFEIDNAVVISDKKALIEEA